MGPARTSPFPAAVPVRDASRLLAALLTGLLLGGCASVPTRGPVQQGGQSGFGAQDGFVRVLAPPPSPGAGAQDVVLGFLRASANFEDGHAVARQYLTEEARTRWRPGAEVRILDSAEAYTVEVGDAEATLRGRQVGQVDAAGHYRPLRQPRDLSVPFRLAREGGEWRIAELPDGLHLPRYEVDRVYRAVNLYFLDPGQDRLVPDPVLLPVVGLPTAVTTRLLEGPGEELRAAVTTAVPGQTRLALAAVPVKDGVAQVDLTRPALAAEPAARRAMSAQLVWTLRQLPQVREVAIAVDGAPLTEPVAGTPEPFSAYDPAVLTYAPRPHLLVEGRVGYLAGADFVPLKGAAGSGRAPLRHPAVSPDEQRVAAIDPEGRRLYVGRVGEGEPLAERLVGTALVAPSIDVTGTVWTVERGRRDGVVWAVGPDDARPQEVALRPAPRESVVTVRVSRDGTRIAVVTRSGRRSQLQVGVVGRGDGALRVQDLHPVAPDLVEVRDVAWTDADELAVLARQEGGVVQAYAVPVDGLELDSLGTVPDAVSIAAAPRAGPLLETADGEIYEAGGRVWALRGRGQDVFYPG